MLDGKINNLNNVKSMVGQLANPVSRIHKTSETNTANSLNNICQTCTHTSQTTSQMDQSLVTSISNQNTNSTDLSTTVNFPNVNPNAYNAALHLLELTGKNVNLCIAPNCFPVDTSSLQMNTSTNGIIENNSGNHQQYSTNTDSNLLSTLPITSNLYHQQQLAVSGSLESNAINGNTVLSSASFNNQLYLDIMATHIQINQTIDNQIKNLLCLSKLFENGTFAKTFSVYKGKQLNNKLFLMTLIFSFNPIANINNYQMQMECARFTFNSVLSNLLPFFTLAFPQSSLSIANIQQAGNLQSDLVSSLTTNNCSPTTTATATTTNPSSEYFIEKLFENSPTSNNKKAELSQKSLSHSMQMIYRQYFFKNLLNVQPTMEISSLTNNPIADPSIISNKNFNISTGSLSSSSSSSTPSPTNMLNNKSQSTTTTIINNSSGTSGASHFFMENILKNDDSNMSKESIIENITK